MFHELGVEDPIPEPEHWERGLAPTTLFFEVDGEVAAYAFFQPLQGVGYVRHVVVAPERRGRGLGRAVMEALAAHLRDAGCARWCLNVKVDNTPAIRLYERVGMRLSYHTTVVRLGWDAVDRLPTPARPIVGCPVEPADDAAIEAAFDLPTGQIASYRGPHARVLMRLVDPVAPEEARLGFASFDPSFPGSFPFRVADPTLAAPLLAALRPHARPELSWIQLVIEDDEALTRTLVACGASVYLRLAHMRGELSPAG